MSQIIRPFTAQVGAGSAYAYTVHDSNGDLLDGGRNYRLHVDANPPAKNFWAVDVYDTQTRSLLQVPSTIWPALASNSGTLQPNDDGSYDLYFGPTAPAGKESNWVETHPRQVMVPAVPHLRPARTMVRPDLETQRVRAPELTRPTKAVDQSSPDSPRPLNPDQVGWCD